MGTYKRKSWVQKRDIALEPVVKRITKDFAGMKAGERMLIATPQVVDQYIRQLPKGCSGTLTQMRKDLAAEYQADTTCPVTSGIFLRIVAEAAYEEYQKGMALSRITPFWRILSPDSPTACKLSFGTDLLKQQRHREQLDAPPAAARGTTRKKTVSAE
ncbi:MAG TPA: hypothetical protein PKE63_02470 [Lacibacter sp.]|nr:hypothetical protein [Lacibacter sp.]HMO88590.1 hypothetical protein [Lacibacter sp.]HMP86110.1 hypothetical protein [Lacibacter sp.]